MALPYDKHGRRLERKSIDESFERISNHFENSGKDYTSGIAIAKWNSIKELITSADTSRVLLSKSGITQNNRKVRYPELEEKAFEVYRKAGTRAFDAVLDLNAKHGRFFLSKDQVKTLRYQHVDSPMVKQGPSEMLAAWNNVQSKGQVVYWDTETFSGKNKYGQHETDALTEFNFRVITKGADGKWDLSRDNNEGKIFKSIIGSSEEEFQKYNNLIDRFKAGGKKAMSNLEMVTLHRLALTGSAETDFEVDEFGVANFTKFAGKDTKDVMTMGSEVLRRGAQRMRKIGAIQEKSNLVNHSGHMMRGWEREMIRGLTPILKNGVTAMGYNTAGFDWPTLQTFLKRANTTTGFKAALSEITGSKGILPEHQLDIMAGLQNAKLNRKDLYTEEEWKMLHQKGLSSLQQEALAHRGGEAAYKAIYGNLQAHMADTDTYVGAHLALNGDLMDLMDLNKQVRISGSATHLVGGNQQLFMSSTGRHIKDFGLWGFRKDNLTGEYRTTDGFAISTDDAGETNVRKEIMEQFLFKKEANYSIHSIQKLNGDSQFGSFLGVLNPDLNKEGLFAVTLNSVVEQGQETLVSRSPVTIVGTEDKIEQFFSQTMYHVADKGKDGKWKLSKDRQMRRDLSLIFNDSENGKRVVSMDVNSSPEQEEKMLKYIINNGTMRMKYESAARDARAFDYKKDTGVLAFLDDMQKMVGSKNGAVSKKAEQEFINLVENNSRKLENKLRNLKKGEKIAPAEIDMTFHSYFGYKDFSDDWKPNVFTETVSKQLARVEHVRKNRYLYETAMRHARKRAGLPEMPEKMVEGTNAYMADVGGEKRHLVNAYYRQYVQSFENAAVDKYGEKVARNMQDRGAYAYTKNTFEVNLRGYKPDITEDKYVRFNLNASGLGYADQLLKAVGVDPELRGYEDHEKVAELQKFQSWLHTNGQLNNVDDAIATEIKKDRKKGIQLRDDSRIKDDDHPELAAQRLISEFKKERELDPLSGMNKDTYRYMIVDQATENKNLSITDIDSIAKDLDASIPDISITEGDNVKLHAQEITDKILFGGKSAEEVNAQLTKAGYNKDQIELLTEARAQRFKDTQRFMEGYLSSAIKNGVDVGYDTKSGSVWFAHQGQTMMIDDLLPKDVFENGMFYTKIGRTKTASPLGFYDVDGRLKYSSLIAKAAPSGRMMDYVMRHGVEEGNLLEQLAYISRSFDKSLRESSSVDNLDAQDRKAAMHFNYRDVVAHMNELSYANGLQSSNEDINDILGELISRPAHKMPTYETITTSQRIAINSQITEILEAAANQAGAPQYIKDKVADLKYSTKKSGDFIATFDDMLDFGEDLATTKRGIHNQSSRAIHFNKTAAEEELGDYDVKFGQAISSKARSYANTHIDGDVGYDVDVTARVNRMAMSARDMRSVVNSMSTLDDDYTLDLLTSIHTDEGSGAIDGRIADRIFNYRNSMQTVSLDSIYERNASIQDIEGNLGEKGGMVSPHLDKRAAAAFNIEAVNGELKFSYGDGTYVKAGEGFIAKKTHNGEAETVHAKEEGLLRLGVFSKDGRHLAHEEAINKLLKSISIKDAATAEEVEKAKEYAFQLIQKNYNLSYYIKGLDAATNLKLAEMGAEKGMLRSMIATTGAINERISKTLDKAGLNALKGMALDIEYIDSLKSGKAFGKTAFGIMAAGISSKSAEEIQSAIVDEFGNISNFHAALEKERYTPWDKFTAGLKELGINEQIHAISNTFSAEKKHKDAKVLFNRTANALLDKYGDDKEKVFGLLKDVIPQLQLKNGEFIVNGSYEASLGKLQELVKNEGLKSRRTLSVNGNELDADIARVDMELEPNFDRGRSYEEGSTLQKAIKLNHRAQVVLGGQRMDDNRKERVRKALMAESENGQELYDKYIAGYKNKDIVSQGAVDAIKDNIYTRAGDKSEDIATFDEKEGRIVINRALEQKLKNDGISKDVAQSIVDVAARKGANKISRRVIEERYAAQSFAHAFQFNKTGGAHFNTDGMQVLNVLDMTLPKNGASAKEFMDSAYKKEFLLDLHLPNSDRQLYSEGTGLGRHVYVPYAPPKIMPNGELAISPYQKTLGKIHRLVSDYNSRMDGTSSQGPMSQADKDKFFDNMSSAVTELKTNIRTGLTSKNGYIASMSRAHLEDSGIYTAYGNQLFGGEKSKFFSKLEFQGMNLSKMASKGTDAALDLDYTILSKKAMHKFYDKKSAEIFDKLGLQDQLGSFQAGLYDHLETKGTVALNVREPQGYAKSTSVSATYFSDVVRGDEAIVGVVQHNSKKGDYDSDKVEAALLKGKAYIEANGRKITRELDWGMFNKLSETDGINVSWASPEVEKQMNNHISAMFVNAESNKLWRMKDNILQEHVDSFSGSHLSNFTVEGSSTGTLVSRMAISDEGQKKALRDRFNSLYESARSYYADKYTADADGANFEKFMTSATQEEVEQNLDLNKETYKRRRIHAMLQDKEQVGKMAQAAGMEVADFRQSARDALGFRLTEQLNEMEATTNSLKLGAGEMNYNLFGYLKIAQEANGIDAEDFAKITQVHAALGEAFLSPKNEENIDVKQIDKLKSAMGNAYKAMQGRYDAEDAAREFKEVILPTLKDRAGKEMSQLPGFLNNPNANIDALIEDAADTYTKKVIMASNLQGVNPKMYDIGVTKGLTREDSELVTTSDESYDMLQDAMDTINEQARAQGKEAPIAEVRGARANAPSSKIASVLEDRPRLKLDADTARAITPTEAVKGIAQMFEHVNISGRGAAVAVAGGLLLSGYVSNPSQPAPATTQANGADQEFQDMYSTAEVPSFSDSGMNSMRGGPKQGYVINISAQSASGRQQAVNAINSAIGGAVPSASSVNVSMNTSFADKVSQLQIDRMVANAFS